MKNLKLISLAAIAFAALLPVSRAAEEAATPAPAKHEGGPRKDMKKMREHRMQVLEEKLNLTADQKTQINAIWDKAEAQAKTARQDKSLSREDRREKVREAMQGTRAQVRAVLTPEQQKIFDTLPKEGPRGGPPHDGPPPADGKGE